MIEYLRGRSGRKEYWVSIGILLLVGVVLAFLPINGASGATTFLWFIVWGRRLHDLGKSAAWVLAPLVAMIVAAALMMLLGGDALLSAVKATEAGQNPPNETGVMWLFGLFAALLAIQIGFTIWLGAVKGDAGDNKFGPPPKDNFS